MLLGAGTYGQAAVGSYGGLFDETGSELFPEAGTNTGTSSISTPDATASGPAATVPVKAASSAIPADRSTAVLVAGVMVALSALLL